LLSICGHILALFLISFCTYYGWTIWSRDFVTPFVLICLSDYCHHFHYQENNREKLDKDYDELLKESLLDFNKKNKKYDKEDKKEEKEIIDEYDIALNAMLYDVKTKPTDRYI
jgi:hypothetical protein